MNNREALIALSMGKKITRPSFSDGYYYQLTDNGVLMNNHGIECLLTLDSCNDWIEIKDLQWYDHKDNFPVICAVCNNQEFIDTYYDLINGIKMIDNKVHFMGTISNYWNYAEPVKQDNKNLLSSKINLN